MTLRLRGDTAANWTAANPVLSSRQPGFETNTGQIKIGDGVTAWNSLPYRFTAAAWGGITGTLSDQTDLNTALNGKQATLVSTTNIKTINGSSILGAGDLAISASAVWGGITGTLSAQADLQAALNAKVDTAGFDAAVAATPAVTTNTAKVTNATHTGDVTGATALTIANDTVTNAKLANMATATIKGRTTAGTGDPEDLTGTQATALLDTFTSAAKGLVPASGGGTTNFLRADGTFAAPAGGGSSAYDYGKSIAVNQSAFIM